MNNRVETYKQLFPGEVSPENTHLVLAHELEDRSAGVSECGG